MSAVVACIVCARPLDSLLTSGLQAGVWSLTVVALVVIGAIVRGAYRLWVEDAASLGSETPGGTAHPRSQA